MDRPTAADARHRGTRLIEEAGSLLELLPGLLDENEQMRARVESTQQDADRAHEEILALKSEIAQLRRDHDEVTSMCTSAMKEVADNVNELITKLRPAQRPSPFMRDPAVTASDVASRTPVAMASHP